MFDKGQKQSSTLSCDSSYLYFIIQDLFCVLLQFIFPIIFSIFIIITNDYHKDERIIEERKCHNKNNKDLYETTPLLLFFCTRMSVHVACS